MAARKPAISPADHPAHWEPLARRLIEQRIGAWLDIRYGLAMAAAENDGVQAGIDRLMHGHLHSYHYSLVPLIMDDLRRAGVIT